VSPPPPAGTDQPILQARTEDWLKWAFGMVLLWRLLFPFFDSPLLHLFSDPARHWANGGRFFLPDLIGAGDPFLYQLWIYLLRTLSQGDQPSVVLGCALLCAAMPYGWYRALRELLPRQPALIGGVIIGLTPAFIGIYAYFMTETLLLTLTGFAFWATFRCARKQTLAAYALASGLWVCAIFTRSIALPMAVLCLGMLWLTQRQRLGKALSAAAAFTLLAVPAGLHTRSTLGFFAPLGNFYLSQIYSASGEHDIGINAGPLGAWGFGTPSFYNPTFYPFSSWTTDRVGTAYISIDVSRGRASWIEEKKRIESRRRFPWRRQYEENLVYLLFGQSWPDNDPHALSGLATVWTRWLWPPLMLLVACGVVRRRYRSWEWLLPVCALGMLLSLAVQRDGIIEGRYRKPIDPVLLAAAIVLYYRTRSGRAATSLNEMPSYDASFFEYVNASASAAAERIVPLLQQQLSPASVLDVGCGQGAWLAVWQRHGVDDVFGVDGSYVDRSKLLFAPGCFYAHDLSQPFDLGRRFSLVECLEVAEHLPPGSAEALVDSLIRHGEVIVFSAAPPGQGGHDHVNERSYGYWRTLFSQRGYLAADYLRPRILDDPTIDRWYRYNTLLYVSRDAMPRLNEAVQASLIPDASGVPDLSPLSYRIRKQLVSRLPVALMTALARMKERATRAQSQSPPPRGSA
jgi:SAM-dependent methyltransferase/4-amino-4-deoxy-L-arabinose transferase-like glycosyltransferase